MKFKEFFIEQIQTIDSLKLNDMMQFLIDSNILEKY